MQYTFKIIRADGMFHWPLTVDGSFNQYVKPRVFSPIQKANAWIAHHFYKGCSYTYLVKYEDRTPPYPILFKLMRVEGEYIRSLKIDGTFNQGKRIQKFSSLDMVNEKIKELSMSAFHPLYLAIPYSEKKVF